MSAVTPRPAISKKLIMFPTPKYRRIRKRVKPEAIRPPLLVLAKTVEKVKRRATKRIRKNAGTIPKVEGLTKQIIVTISPQERRIIIRAGKKFFLLFTSFFLVSFRTTSF